MWFFKAGCLPYLEEVVLKGKWLRGVYSRFSPADSSGSSDHSLHGRSISDVYFINSKFNSSISGIISWLQQNTIWVGCFCAALSSAAEKQKWMLILQCIAYHQGEEGLMRFGNVYYCGGEILGVFYIPPRSLSLLHRAEQRRQKHWGPSPVILQLKSISINSQILLRYQSMLFCWLW